jgi:hypothetical protein
MYLSKNKLNVMRLLYWKNSISSKLQCKNVFGFINSDKFFIFHGLSLLYFFTLSLKKYNEKL